VDERTLAERLGTAIPQVAGARPPPPGWPREALRFPLKKPGLGAVLGGTAFLALLDVLSWWNLFAGGLLKALALPFYVRWHLHVVATSAGGHDHPATWLAAVDLHPDHFRQLLTLLLQAFVLLAPGVGVLVWGPTALGLLLLLLGSVWLAVAVLGSALGDGKLVLPWHAVAWISTRPLPLLVGASAFWAAGLAEWLVAALASAPLPAALAVFLPMRFAVLWLWLLSARALGVLGREWSPWAFEPGAPGEAT
jgi:hypothetical protein